MQNQKPKSKNVKISPIFAKNTENMTEIGVERVRGEQISKSISSETKSNRILRLMEYHQGKWGRGYRAC